MAKEEGKKIVALTVEEIAKISSLAKRGLWANKSLMYEIMAKDPIIGKEDLEQEILIKLLLVASKDGMDPLSVFNYVATIAHNVLSDISRKVQNQKHQPKDGIELISLDSMRYESDEDDARSVEEETADLRKMPMEEKAMATIILTERFKNLSQKDKKLFKLLYIKGFNQETAAKILGVTPAMICKKKKMLDTFLFID